MGLLSFRSMSTFRFKSLRVLFLLLGLASLQTLHGLSYDGEIALPDTAGGIFGAITDVDDPDPSAWFGVDGYPAKIIRIRLGIAKIGNDHVGAASIL